MLSVIRNLFVTVAGFVAAFLATASVQAALDFGLPVLSVRSIAGTNVSTLVMLASLAIFFFAMAYLAPAWMRTKVPVLWLLAPPVALYVVAILVQPYVYQCYRMPICWVIQAPFVIGIVAISCGAVAFRLKRGASDHAANGVNA
jgi:hypothetical protein